MRFSSLIFILFLCFVPPALKSQGNSAAALEEKLRSASHDTVRVDLLNKLSFAYRPSDPGKALEYGKKALDLALKSGRENDIARSYHTLGTINYLVGRHAEALPHYLESLKIREKNKDSVNIAKIYNNIALIHYEMKNLDESMSYHNKSIEIKKRRNDKYGLAQSYGNLGNVYNALINLPGNSYRTKDSLLTIMSDLQYKALELHKEVSAANPDESQYQLSVAYDYNNIGNIYFEKAQLKGNDPSLLRQSMSFHLLALPVHRKYNDIRGTSHSLINLAGIFHKLNQHSNALEYYNEALSVVESHDLKEELKTVYEGLSQVHESMNDMGKALKYHKKFVAAKDSIMNETKLQQLNEIKEKFQVEKREQEIENLKIKEAAGTAELEKEKVKNKYFTIAFVLAAFLIIVSIAFFINLRQRFKNNQKVTRTLEEQHILIAQKNKEITSSIKYAKRIQEAVLPPEHDVKRILPDSFVLYKPKDIVSGDFYWLEEWGNNKLAAVVDCTGHGVPGAFMSIVGYNLLNQAVNHYGLDKPGLILNHMNKWLYKILHQTYEESAVKDGMDICLISIDKTNLMLEYAGAFNPLWIVRNGELVVLKADKFPVGAFIGEELRSFTTHEFQLMKGDVIYLFSDGYADQFGGPDGKKFKYNQLRKEVVDLSKLDLSSQKNKLDDDFENWRSGYEQVDDVCIVGIKI